MGDVLVKWKGRGALPAPGRSEGGILGVITSEKEGRGSRKSQEPLPNERQPEVRGRGAGRGTTLRVGGHRPLGVAGVGVKQITWGRMFGANARCEQARVKKKLKRNHGQFPDLKSTYTFSQNVLRKAFPMDN